MSIGFYKCDVCGGTFSDAELYVSTKEDLYICEECLEKIGFNEDNQNEFVDEDGYLLDKYYTTKEKVVQILKLVMPKE
jgi:DNA-directed RNA polymerase subunit RPC12/RpoP